MTDEQREIIRHSLGLSHPSCKGKPYRKHYCANVGEPKLEAIVECGWMERGTVINEGKHQYYWVTAAGAAAVGSTLPTPD